jgi:class 3 adenylate cyclase
MRALDAGAQWRRRRATGPASSSSRAAGTERVPRCETDDRTDRAQKRRTIGHIVAGNRGATGGSARHLDADVLTFLIADVRGFTRFTQEHSLEMKRRVIMNRA